MSTGIPKICVRNTRVADAPAIIRLCHAVYPESPPWTEEQLRSHLAVFPEGQFVAEDAATHDVVGMAASLIVHWEDYDLSTPWRAFTSAGFFTNHDPRHGRTLYAAEVMVAPDRRGQGIGKALYAARRALARRLGLTRIRAGARLRGYHRYADRMSPEAYAAGVAVGRLTDATLTFQLRQGFRVVGVARDYLRHDPESRGHAAVIEWLNPQAVVVPEATAA